MEKHNTEGQYSRAKKKVDKIKGFYTHAIVYVVVNIMLLVMIYAGCDNSVDFWNLGSFSTAIGWGVGLLIHAISVFGHGVLFSRMWEDQKIKQFLKEEEQNNHK
jgi:hypothetical protein